MGIINVSPESFFKGSIKTGDDQVATYARQMEKDGAHVIDIGAMSTAPYSDSVISLEQEITRIAGAIKAARKSCSLPISADTPRAKTAQAAIEAGADAINDVTGLKHDGKMAEVISGAGVGLIACAHGQHQVTGRISDTVRLLGESLTIARGAGIRGDRIIVDPSIGFFRSEGKNPFFTKSATPWYVRDVQTIARLAALGPLKKPICVSASRKSFIGHLLNLESPEERLVPSIACELVSVLNGADLVRTHSVAETVQALTTLEILRGSHTSKRL